MNGPLSGLRVVELASEHAAFAGKLVADLGADVVLVEPPDGHYTREFAPFLGDEPGGERSLWFWHYNTSKRGVTLDLARERDVFRRLVATADIVLEGEPPGRLAELGLDPRDLLPSRPELIWVSVTPFGRSGPRALEQATDLTVLASGGPVWNCGYDDHSLPPVRGGGNQGYHTASLWAVMALLTAVVHRDASGRGQLIDVSMHAAANVTTEAGSYEWLVAHQTVQRQTGRHAATRPTRPTDAVGTDGRYLNTGVPPRSADEFRSLLEWLDQLGLRDAFDEAALLEMGIERGGVSVAEIADDPLAREILGAGREALQLIATRIPSYDFFMGAQTRGIPCGVIYSPDEVIEDPHFVARGFPVEVHHEDLERSFVYPGAPFVAHRSPWRISRRAPHIGEHNDEVLRETEASWASRSLSKG